MDSLFCYKIRTKLQGAFLRQAEKLTLFSQDVGCVLPGESSLGPRTFLEKLIGQLNKKEISELLCQIENFTP